MKKIILWVGIVILAFIVFIFFLGLYADDIRGYMDRKRDERVMAFAKEQEAKFLELQKNDNYGGKTPEETLDLYIKALKEGNIELASKYYEISLENPDLQKNKLSELKADSSEDLINISIENLTKIRDLGLKKAFSDDYVSIVYKYITNKESTTTMNVSRQEILVVKEAGIKEEIGKAFKLNPYTKVWKIIQ